MREVNAPITNAFLLNHPVLDIRGGGDHTFEGVKLAFTTDPDDGSVIRYFAANWKLNDAGFGLISAFGATQGWSFNPTDPLIDLQQFTVPPFTFDTMLADLTRKPFVLKRVGVEPD